MLVIDEDHSLTKSPTRLAFHLHNKVETQQTKIMKLDQIISAKRAIVLFAVPLLLAVLAFPAMAALFGPKGDTNEEKRAQVRKQRDEILAKLYAAHPEVRDKIKKAVGYGAFNNKNLNLFLLSTGHGYGMVVDNKTGKETFMAMGSIGGGVGMGAKDLSVVFIYKTADVMNKFVESGWQFGGEADATAKAGEKGGAVAKEGAVDTGANLFEIYQMTDAGVALQATVAGTKYWKDKDLNP
jgi:lipid-binding SYLF domain-containing protein